MDHAKSRPSFMPATGVRFVHREVIYNIYRKQYSKGIHFSHGQTVVYGHFIRSCLGGAAHVHSETGYSDGRALGTWNGFQGSCHDIRPLQIYPF
jgi:hypothetical protein